jgi:HAD superfamily hydrolase (TIGR01549 family)
MNKLSSIKIISLDLGGTLISVYESYDYVWKEFLRENYTDEFAKKNWDRSTEIVLENMHKAALNGDKFNNVRSIFENAYMQIFSEIHLDYDPRMAASVLIQGHKMDRFFDDAKPFIKEIKQKYTVCLSTDCDTEMLGNINELYDFDKMFVSEDLQVYKLNPKFFKHVIKHYNVSPENILHIGDSESDIIAPRQLGIITCWLNRNNHKWDQAIKPDFEVKSLLEILDILD